MDDRRKYIELLISMALDDLQEAGPTPRAMVYNLRMIADELERMIPADADNEGRGSDDA